jgi:hypothetical protein
VLVPAPEVPLPAPEVPVPAQEAPVAAADEVGLPSEEQPAS